MNLLKNKVFFFLLIFSLLILQAQVFGQAKNFRFVVEERLARTPVMKGSKMSVGIRLEEVCDVDNDKVADRVFREYGAIFVVGKEGMLLPPKCVFSNDSEVQAYQSAAKVRTQNISGTTITLQEKAMDDLLAAVAEAGKKNLRISPRGGSIAAKRSYQETVDLWYSRFNPGLTYWTGRGRISRREAEMVRTWGLQKQVGQVLEWEKQGIWFSKDLSKSILYSVAAPGASQHIFMLALDVEQYANRAVREILANHGWFQTVRSDLPHFTYLGVPNDKNKLESLGLKSVSSGGQTFWVPNLD